MQYRTFGKLGIQGSLFGLGCMRFNGEASGDSIIDEKKAISLIRRAIDGGVNYMDTAYVYLGGTSEIVLGKALLDGYREKVTVATKLPIDAVHCYEDMDKVLNEQLSKLQTDHIDFYLLHGINREKWDRFKELGAKEWMEERKQQGKIKYKSFSFHGSYEDFEYIIKDYDWDMCQIQYNFMDVNNQAGEKGLKLAGSMGIPVVIMEGLLGGKLAKAPSNVQELYDAFPIKRTPVEWAFKWLGDHPEVSCVLSGCNEVEQIDDNLRIFDSIEIGSMTGEEHELIDKAREAYYSRTKIGCTTCKYCLPCPMGVEIPRVFKAWNEVSQYGGNPCENWDVMELKRLDQVPTKCIECGACEAKCPQSLAIRDKLKEAWKEIG